MWPSSADHAVRSHPIRRLVATAAAVVLLPACDDDPTSSEARASARAPSPTPRSSTSGIGCPREASPSGETERLAKGDDASSLRADYLGREDGDAVSIPVSSAGTAATAPASGREEALHASLVQVFGAALGGGVR